MMKWSEPIKVNSHDTDYNGVLRAGGVLKYMQEAANMQLHELGPSNDELMEKGGFYSELYYSQFDNNIKTSK